MQRNTFFSNPILRYILTGVLFGCLFPIFGMLLSIWLAHMPLTASNLGAAQSSQPLLWIIDTAPLVLGFTFGLIGRREVRLLQDKAGLELNVEKSTSELRQANQELQKELDERIRIESLITLGKKEWENTFDAISDLIFLTDDQDKIVRCNRAATDSLHKSYLELIGQPLAGILFPDHALPAHMELFGRQDIEFPGFEGHFDISVYSILMGGNTSRTLYILHDITARRLAENETIRQKQYFEALVVNNPAAIVVLDNEGKVQSCNPAFERLYGYSSEEVLDKPIDVLITSQEMAAEAQRYTQQARVGPVQGMVVRLRKDGSLVDVELLAVPVKVGTENIGTLAIYHDITELLRARRQAEAANQAKSEFVANMSHEIRTPLNGVIGMIELTLDTTLNDEQRDYLEVALHSADTLLTLLNDILDYSKIEAKRLEFETIDFNLRTTVEDVAFSLAPRAQAKGLEIACLIHPDLHSGLRGDPARLRQVLINLVGNAIKFTHQGEIVVRAEPILDEPTHATIRFSVQDTGIGIPKDRQEAIFERFTQADGSTTRRYGGTGLGLAICKQLVDALGGQISVESIPGQGSTFIFTLRFEKQTKPALGKTRPLQLSSVNIKSLHILAVDDNATNRLILTHMLESLDCRIETASGGAKGLEMLGNAWRSGDPYRMVLLDMQMPGMSGEQTARLMLEHPAGKQTSIIILTSMGQRGDAARLEAIGCAGYLPKPVKQHMLYAAMIAVLGQKSSQIESAGLVTRHTISEAERQGLRILLAEDNPVNQKLTVILLQKAGFSVDAVEDGLQAVEKVKTGQYSAVLMDVQMPELDGLEAARRIRTDLVMPRHIPIIAMTADALESDRAACLEAGMDDYISKPIDSKTLLTILDRWTVNQVQDKAPGVEQQASRTQVYLTASEEFPLNAGPTSPGTSLVSERPVEPGSKPAIQLVSPFIEEPPSLPMDIQLALPYFDNDQAIFNEMCLDLIRNMPARMQELRGSLARQDTASFSRAAHNLKGISANFSATQVNRIASELELLGRQEDLSAAGDLLDQLEFENKRLFEYMLSLGVKPIEPL